MKNNLSKILGKILTQADLAVSILKSSVFYSVFQIGSLVIQVCFGIL